MTTKEKRRTSKGYWPQPLNRVGRLKQVAKCGVCISEKSGLAA